MNIERRIRENAIGGTLTDMSSPTPTDNDPCEGRSWGVMRQVSAVLIREILTQQIGPGKRATSLRIKGACIVGHLNLDSAEILCPLVLDSCYLDQVQLGDAKTTLLDFRNSCIADGIDANGLRCTSNLILTNCKTGPVILTSAWIEGSVGCDGAWISERTGDRDVGYSLVADGVVIQRGLFLRGCHTSRIKLMGASISGNLEFQGATLKLSGTQVLTHAAFSYVVLSLDVIQVEGHVFLSEGFHATGAIFMRNARLGGLACNGAHFETPEGWSIEMDGADIQHDVLWNGVRVNDGASCLGIRVAGSWQCSGAHITATRSVALMADGSRVGNAMFLNKGFSAVGEVRLLGIRITQSLDCEGGSFQARPGTEFNKALSLDGAQIGGGAFFGNGFHAQGEVCLRGVHVGGPLKLNGAEFKNSGAIAFVADGAKVEGDIVLQNTKVNGLTQLIGVRVSQHVICEKSVLRNQEQLALDLSYAQIAQKLDIRDTIFVGSLTVANAKAARWHFDPIKYSDVSIDVFGFIYDSLTQEICPPQVPVNAWIQWLQRRTPLSPQPYQQMVRVLRTMGHLREAQEVAISGRRALRKNLGVMWRVWDKLLDCLIGYGYRSERAFGYLGLVLVVGWIVFSFGAQDGVMVPSQHRAYIRYMTTRVLPHDYPRFHPYLYSLGETLPLITTRQTTEWHVRRSEPIEIWTIFQKLASGFLWLLAAAGLTGLIRKED